MKLYFTLISLEVEVPGVQTGRSHRNTRGKKPGDIRQTQNEGEEDKGTQLIHRREREETGGRVQVCSQVDHNH